MVAAASSQYKGRNYTVKFYEGKAFLPFEGINFLDVTCYMLHVTYIFKINFYCVCTLQK
jgi:hypothetical protein